MAAQCFNCGKGVMYGHNVSHAKNRTRRIFKPNLHSARITISGFAKKVKLCTKCLRSLKQTTKAVEEDVRNAPQVEPQVVVTAS